MKVLLFANTDWYLYNFRLALAECLRASGHDVVLVSPPGGYAQKLIERGFRHIPFSFSRRGIVPTAELSVILRLYGLYRREKPDLAHHFTIKCVLYGSIAARLVGGLSVVNTIPGLGYVFLTGKLGPRVLRPLVKTLYRGALSGTHVVFQNPDDRSTFVNAGLVRRDFVHLIRGSGVDVDRFIPAERKDERAVRVLFAGRLLVSKGLSEFVEAARLAKICNPDLRFVVAGEPDLGNPSSVAYETVLKWQNSGLVDFIGHSNDMPRVISAADIAVLPSYGEGLPRFLLEAASCGLPLIASDVPGCREIVRHGVNGYLVAVRDPIRLALAILALAGDPELRRVMGAESRRIVCREFSLVEVLRQTREVYSHAVSGQFVLGEYCPEAKPYE